MLTHHQQKVLNNAFKYANKRSDIENRAMIKDMARLWSGGKIPYAYAADIGKIILKSKVITTPRGGGECSFCFYKYIAPSVVMQEVFGFRSPLLGF